MSETEKVAEDNGIGKPKIKGMPETDENNVIGSSRTNVNGKKKTGSVGTTSNGAIGSKKAESQKVVLEDKPKVKKDSVAVHSTRNVTWPGVGKVSKGYNIVTPAEAEQWKTRNHIRVATPEEVAREFGL
jgi:hypothetical protein